jgi:sirohydrochlorin cobaltochelatase
MPRAIVLIDHGSQVEASNRLVEAVAAELRAGFGPGVLVAHAHQGFAPPSLEEAVDAVVRAGATAVTVVPFFLGRGRHATEDVPRIAAAAMARHAGVALHVTPPLGEDASGLADLVRRLVDRDAGSGA